MTISNNDFGVLTTIQKLLNIWKTMFSLLCIGLGGVSNSFTPLNPEMAILYPSLPPYSHVIYPQEQSGTTKAPIQDWRILLQYWEC